MASVYVISTANEVELELLGNLERLMGHVSQFSQGRTIKKITGAQYELFQPKA